MDSLEAIAALLKENDDFLIISHVSPDGDTLGSALALAHMLESLGKQAQVVCADKVPHIYGFLPGALDILLPEQARAARVAIAVDCADAQRLDTALPLFEAAETSCNIDHHMTNTQYADFNYIQGKAAATGELIFALLCALGVEPDAHAASCLYAALISDTGNFAYANTTPETLRIAARLMECGAEHTRINRLIFRTTPLHKKKLLGAVLTKLALYEDGKIGAACLSKEEVAACGATEEDAEGIIDHIRDVEGVELALFIRESQAGVYKVSLRSKFQADVGDIAKLMGGGGHKRAAGYTALGDMDGVAAEALRLARDAVRA